MHIALLIDWLHQFMPEASMRTAALSYRLSARDDREGDG